MKTLMTLMIALAGWNAFANLAPLKEHTLSDGRVIVANAQSLSVYTFDRDTGSTSQCYDACATVWPPVLVPAGTVVAAPLGLTSRRDGALQVTFDGKPVYLFHKDAAPGDIKGDGLQGVWHLIVRK